jgi:F1F0 ATPase subunit 2
MGELLSPAFALVTGILLGAVFYGGLWWTVRRGVSSRRAVHWFLASLVLRLSVVACGFYFVSAGHWQRLLLCLFGFVMARLAVTWLTRPPVRNQLPRTAGSSDAP